MTFGNKIVSALALALTLLLVGLSGCTSKESSDSYEASVANAVPVEEHVSNPDGGFKYLDPSLRSSTFTGDFGSLEYVCDTGGCWYEIWFTSYDGLAGWLCLSPFDKDYDNRQAHQQNVSIRIGAQCPSPMHDGTEGRWLNDKR